MRTDLAAHRVAVTVVEGAPVFEVSVACEVFGIDRPDLADPWYEMWICAERPDTALAHGLALQEAHPLDSVVEADTVLVPNCTEVDRAPRELAEAVRAAYDNGARVASICTGAFVLAAAGLLDGRTATTHWMHAAELAAAHPKVRVDPAVLYVEDGGVYTSAGTAAGIDLCLELVRADHGTAVANALARRLVTPPHREGGQAQYVEAPALAHDDTRLAPLLEWARSRLAEPLTLDDLARRANLSRRTLARRFEDALGVPPLRWLLCERVRRAQLLLETTGLPVEQVAEASGLGSAANLRRHFTRHVGVAPLAYRRAFLASRERRASAARS
ncbi:helix-turn-helix domain-containing protein [Nocardiopsis sp. RSe5-2]|uniref:Helix-turn-helix domain-containing protein n=1 Tax=Nocardiopsis endophytica TaxID=3018445 RepID=A0ABT4U1N6_9ACTN|nr:helix-turn-helix domain-containing protein [Nocardiopsis endophytica]MDA2810865.1 helix-turn-helix domain-containing protein [Nocardiopsis endophytica]